MLESRKLKILGIFTLLFGSLSISPGALAQEAFDPARAFCERQTFTLDNVQEVKPWLDYLSGLRNGRSEAPGDECNSSTVRAIVNMSRSGSVERAEASRWALLQFYVSRAFESDLVEKRYDTDNSFRYRNDLLLSSFVWLLCPGKGNGRTACAKELILKFPDQFLSSSPVLCDFASGDMKSILWPEDRRGLPLLCSQDRNGQVDAEEWLEKAAINFGD
ncbi:hypothetical protein HRR99_22050 [Agrobacterium vaccinii]|uniref:hypothetical protein n=1 Tax=Agrobacterium vaccinii TaxID=2735528 RepID=UPI001E55B26C|nr:hypothetical protein [Agrobacterium vaccinii]UHS64193.1 hypothetical protein HRR99_22050 [Agrobacterium vaccinii]